MAHRFDRNIINCGNAYEVPFSQSEVGDFLVQTNGDVFVHTIQKSGFGDEYRPITSSEFNKTATTVATDWSERDNEFDGDEFNYQNNSYLSINWDARNQKITTRNHYYGDNNTSNLQNHDYLGTALFHDSLRGSEDNKLPLLKVSNDVLQPDEHPEITNAYVPDGSDFPVIPHCDNRPDVLPAEGDEIKYVNWIWDGNNFAIQDNLFKWYSASATNKFITGLQKEIDAINSATWEADPTISLSLDFSETKWDNCEHAVVLKGDVNLSDFKGNLTLYCRGNDYPITELLDNSIEPIAKGGRSKDPNIQVGAKSTKDGLYVPNYSQSIIDLDNQVNKNKTQIDINTKNINIINNTTISQELPQPQQFQPQGYWASHSTAGFTDNSLWYVNNGMLNITINCAWLQPWEKGGQLRIDMSNWTDVQGNKITDRIKFVPATSIVNCTASGRMSAAGNLALVNIQVNNGLLTATANDMYDLTLGDSSKGVAVYGQLQIILNPLHQKLVNQ